MLSIKSKIVFSYTVLFGILLLIFSLVIFHSSKKAAFAKMDARLARYSLRLQSDLEERIGEDQTLEPGLISSIPAEGLEDLHVQIFDLTGARVLADSELTDLVSHRAHQTDQESLHYDTLNGRGREFRCLWSPIELEEDRPYIVQIAASTHELREDLAKQVLLFSILVPLVLLCSGLIAYVLSRAAFKPITRMAATARSITAANLDMRLQLPDTHDEVRQLGETLNEMIARLDQAFKSQKQFVADASHEMRTPLTIMQTELEIAERNSMEEETRAGVRIALSEIENLNTLTKSLLTLVKLDSMQITLDSQPLRMDELLIECTKALQRTAESARISLELTIDGGTELRGDREKLRGVFINLIDNAVKFSTADSRVSIQLSRADDAHVRVAIANDGPGISAADMPFIFKQFYRSNDIRARIHGSGLGLAIVQKIVELHQGTITIDSTAGKGATAVVVLPVA